MKRYRLILLILALTISPFVFTNCNRSLGEKLNDNDSPGINFQLFREKFESNQNLQVLDTRTLDEYKSGHIPGALILPVQDLES